MLPELVQCVYAQSGKCIVRRLSLEGDSKVQAASTGEQIDLDAFIESIQSIYGLHENECASNPASRIHGSVVVATGSLSPQENWPANPVRPAVASGTSTLAAALPTARPTWSFVRCNAGGTIRATARPRPRPTPNAPPMPFLQTWDPWQDESRRAQPVQAPPRLRSAAAIRTNVNCALCVRLAAFPALGSLCS